MSGKFPSLFKYNMSKLLGEMGFLVYADSPDAGEDHPIPQGFSSVLLKPYIKAVTQFCGVEWWRTLMVECVTVF